MTNDCVMTMAETHPNSKSAIDSLPAQAASGDRTEEPLPWLLRNLLDKQSSQSAAAGEPAEPSKKERREESAN